MLVHFDWMKKKLSVRAFQDYVNSGTRLDFRAFDAAWKALFPADAARARKLWSIAECKMREEAYAEALLLSNGDTIGAELMLIQQLIPPPSFTELSDCAHCGILPARASLEGDPSCAWCGLISVEECSVP